MTGLQDNGAYANWNLDDLPGKVAQVQQELQQLEEATQQAKQKVRHAELANQQHHVSQQLLQQQLQQNSAIVYKLQMQQADLLTLKRAKAQLFNNTGKQAVLQDKHKAARQQLKHVTISFEAICNKFQVRFQSEEMDSTAAATADALAKLHIEGQAAHQDYCQQQQLSQEAAQLLEHGQQSVRSLHSAIADKQRQLHQQDRQLQQLKAALTKAGASSQAQAVRESNTLVQSQIHTCKDRTANFKFETERLEADHLNRKQQNDRMELETGTLQTALQALSASSKGPQQPAAHSHTAVTLQSDTGVFCPQAPASALPQSLPADNSARGSIENTTPATGLQQKQQQPAPLKGHRPEGRFQYPEDAPSTGQQVAGHKPQAEYPIPFTTCRQQDQHSTAQKASGHCHGPQSAAYIVEEPDSPVQPALTAQQAARQRPPSVPGMVAATGARDPPRGPPAGCLYQDTTIRRVTTPLKSGKVSGAWAHHEEITVRQVRQIHQSEARLHRLPPPHQPRVVQVTEVKEHHSSGTGNAAVAQQPFQNVNRDHMASRQLSANGTAPDRTHSHLQELATETAAATFAMYNSGGGDAHDSDGPNRRQGRLPSTQGRGGRPAGRSKPVSTARIKPRMKRLFPDDEEPAPYPSDDGRAALRQQWQHEDDMDAELIVNIGSSHA